MLLSVVLTLSVVFVNGWTDAPNAIATCVTTRCISMGGAVVLAAACNFFGVVGMSLVNAAVAETINGMVDFGTAAGEASLALSGALFSIVVWAVLAWYYGIPTSESHALIAGLTGGAIALHGGLDGVSGSAWSKILGGLFGSVLLGFLLGWLICRLVRRLFARVERRRTERFFRGAQLLGAAATSFMHGAQDGEKFLGVLLLCMTLAGEETGRAPLWLMLLCSAVMALGTCLGGKRIIKAVGMDMVRLEKHQGFSADLGASAALLCCSLLGFPASTTHAKTAAILGAGAAGRRKGLRLDVAGEMGLTWLLTFPGCGLIGFFMTKLFLLLS